MSSTDFGTDSLRLPWRRELIIYENSCGYILTFIHKAMENIWLSVESYPALTMLR